ncbi:developmental regulatory protein wetA-like [Nilaparvata lugens]|uniref:developmental regulatory protein wetA-like n=1 Tax=Nilaparvata lugens TaxID=108931 RepID=UPI00193CD1BD|nr:developmental regulatory protein wetA-like [Nilaparvata lugens]
MAHFIIQPSLNEMQHHPHHHPMQQPHAPPIPSPTPRARPPLHIELKSNHHQVIMELS